MESGLLSIGKAKQGPEVKPPRPGTLACLNMARTDMSVYSAPCFGRERNKQVKREGKVVLSSRGANEDW